jgi:hypothetical protein
MAETMVASIIGLCFWNIQKASCSLKFHRIAMEVKRTKIGGRWWFHFTSSKDRCSELIRPIEQFDCGDDGGLDYWLMLLGTVKKLVGLLKFHRIPMEV